MAKLPVDMLEKVGNRLAQIILKQPVSCHIEHGVHHTRHNALVYGKNREMYAGLHVTGLPLMTLDEVPSYMDVYYTFTDGITRDESAIEMFTYWGDAEHQHDGVSTMSVKNTSMLKNLQPFPTMGMHKEFQEQVGKVWENAHYLPGNIFHFTLYNDSLWNIARLRSIMLMPRRKDDDDAHIYPDIVYRLLVLELTTKFPCFANKLL